ncbi:MAG: BBP7 family outer membrane beta-barrel protein [Gemmataceae bacterium]
MVPRRVRLLAWCLTATAVTLASVRAAPAAAPSGRALLRHAGLRLLLPAGVRRVLRQGPGRRRCGHRRAVLGQRRVPAVVRQDRQRGLPAGDDRVAGRSPAGRAGHPRAVRPRGHQRPQPVLRPPPPRRRFSDDLGLGFDAAGFLLDEKSTHFGIASDAASHPVLARPFRNTATNTESVNYLSFPNTVTGGVTIAAYPAVGRRGQPHPPRQPRPRRDALRRLPLPDAGGRPQHRRPRQAGAGRPRLLQRPSG